MLRLTDEQFAVMQAVARGESLPAIGRRLGLHNARSVFDASRARLQRGKGDQPVPFTLEEWRQDPQDPQVSLALLERHQQACEAAQVAFWRVYAGAGAGAVSVEGR